MSLGWKLDQTFAKLKTSQELKCYWGKFHSGRKFHLLSIQDLWCKKTKPKQKFKECLTCRVSSTTDSNGFQNTLQWKTLAHTSNHINNQVYSNNLNCTHTTTQLLQHVSIFKNRRFELIIWLHTSNVVWFCGI